MSNNVMKKKAMHFIEPSPHPHHTHTAATYHPHTTANPCTHVPYMSINVMKKKNA
jgi:hypothetical protein